MEEGENLTVDCVVENEEDVVPKEISEMSNESGEVIAKNDNQENDEVEKTETDVLSEKVDPEILELKNGQTQEVEETCERSCDSRGDFIERQVSSSSSGNQSVLENRLETPNLHTAVTENDIIQTDETKQDLETENLENSLVTDNDNVQSDETEQSIETQNLDNPDVTHNDNVQGEENQQNLDDNQKSAEGKETVDHLSNSEEQNNSENVVKDHNEDAVDLPENEGNENVENNEEDLGVYMDDDMDDDMDSNASEENLKRAVSSNAGRPKSAKLQSEPPTKQRSESRIQFKDPESTEIDDNVAPRVQANTPVSHVGESDNRHLESREATYEQAMNLLSTRCTSTQHDLNNHNDQYSPEYFYIHQTKPTPMPPLKAWRGYHGNVYFEPITINSLQNKAASPISPIERCQNKNHHQLLVTRSRMASRNSIKSRQSTSTNKNRPVTQQVVILDKKTILNRLDDVSPEELAWLNGQDSTGSLSLRPQTVGSLRRPASSRYDRICKGSVSGQMRLSAKWKKDPPKINVYGDRFVHPSALSPLLRSTTQYSLSNQRTLNSSPDLYHNHHGNFDHLPPVEQVRVSLRHIDNSLDNYGRTSPYIRSRKYTDELKPFIKYSPDVKAKYSRKVNI